MSVSAAIPVGRIVSNDELYGVAPNLNANGCALAVPYDTLKVNEITNDTKYLWAIGFTFVGPRLVTGRA